MSKKKTKQNTDGPNPRTNGESKAIQTKSHPEAYTHAQRGEKKTTREDTARRQSSTRKGKRPQKKPTNKVPHLSN